jgi:glutaredoxin-like YruB-family protein
MPAKKKATKPKAKRAGAKRAGVGHEVTVYSTEWCPWCRRVKDFLTENNVKFTAYDVGADQDRAKEMVKKSGQTGVPVLDIDGHVVTGFDEAEIRKWLGLKARD